MAALSPFTLAPQGGTETHEAEECVRHFQNYGCCVFRDAIPDECCDRLTAFVDSMLSDVESRLAEEPNLEAREALENQLLGKVRCRQCRWDLKLPLDPVVREGIMAVNRGALGALLSNQVSNHGQLAELSCLVSEPGAARQPLHSDTYIRADPLITIFVALQDITSEMGPTIVCPGSHNAPVHMSFMELPLAERSSDIVIRNHRGRPALLEKGSALVMDSRLLHCGDANTGSDGDSCRRRLLYSTWSLPDAKDAGSTYTIQDQLKGRWRLEDFSADTSSI